MQNTDAEFSNHRQYLENLLWISDVLSDNSDLDATLERLMSVLLDIFQTDRAWLLYPCDPNTEVWRVPVEATTSDYPGAFAAGETFLIDEGTISVFNEVVSATGPVIFEFSDENTPSNVKKFSIKTQMVISLKPRDDKAWMLGMHQCSHYRNWSEEDKRLFKDISLKVTDMLTQRLLLKRLENELVLKKQAQAELVRAKEEAESASKAKSEFLSVMSHELRTPLTSIQGALGLLLGKAAGDLPDNILDMLAIAQRNGDRLMRLINDLLDISKIEAGKMEVHLARHNLQELLQQAVEANKAYAESMQMSLKLNMPDKDLHAMLDPDKFSQIMANLISNALKFSSGNDNVKISLLEYDGFARVSVKDHGMGIAEEFKPYLFEKFHQYDVTDTRKQGGTGLGLAITKHLVESMNGVIGFHSVAGEGSEFYFDLPLE